MLGQIMRKFDKNSAMKNIKTSMAMALAKAWQKQWLILKVTYLAHLFGSSAIISSLPYYFCFYLLCFLSLLFRQVRRIYCRCYSMFRPNQINLDLNLTRSIVNFVCVRMCACVHVCVCSFGQHREEHTFSRQKFMP